MPFNGNGSPGVIKCTNDYNQSLIIGNKQQYFKLNICNSTNIMDWDTTRILWIGWYQNRENNQCLIKILPKDVLKYILSFVAMDDPYIVL